MSRSTQWTVSKLKRSKVWRRSHSSGYVWRSSWHCLIWGENKAMICQFCLPDISWWGTLTMLNPLALYACLTSLQLRALLSPPNDRDSTDRVHKATCSLHIAHISEILDNVSQGNTSSVSERNPKRLIERFLQLSGMSDVHWNKNKNQQQQKKSLLTLDSGTSTSLQKKKPRLFL